MKQPLVLKTSLKALLLLGGWRREGSGSTSAPICQQQRQCCCKRWQRNHVSSAQPQLWGGFSFAEPGLQRGCPDLSFMS